MEKKRRKIEKGKVKNWKWKEENLQNMERNFILFFCFFYFFIFLFFFFCFSKPLKFVLGVPNGFSTRKKHFTPVKKSGKMTLPHLKNIPVTPLAEWCWCLSSMPEVVSRGVTGILFWGGKLIFPDFFPDMKCFFPVENFRFGWPKINFGRFEKWKGKKKRSSPCFVTFPHSIFIFLLPFLNFPSFLLHFLFFPCHLFPGTSAETSRSEVSGGHSALLPPPCLLCHWL